MIDWALAMGEILAVFEANGFRTAEEETNSISPPCVMVSYPDDVDPHGTYGAAGVSTAELQVQLIVAEATAHNTRDLMTEWGGPGSGGAVAILEAAEFTAMDVLTVAKLHFGVIEITGIRYAAILLDVEIGKGAN